jgi:hypothetical protein
MSRQMDQREETGVNVKHSASFALAILALAATAALAGAAESKELRTARQATARFHSLAVAQAAGYGLLTDAAGIACIDKPGTGGMGVHYVAGALVGDGGIDAARPEALVYEPGRNGRPRLVAVEYVVFKADWDAAHAAPPSLFGQQFALVPAGNRYGLPPFYELHVWLWKQNPRGLFDDWNPRVTCGDERRGEADRDDHDHDHGPRREERAGR